MFQELRFAQPDGCIECVDLAYNAFPLFGWSQFCSSYAESSATKKAFEEARRIKQQFPQPVQPFRTRGSVDTISQTLLQLERPYVAITETDFLDLFRQGDVMGKSEQDNFDYSIVLLLYYSYYIVYK